MTFLRRPVKGRASVNFDMIHRRTVVEKQSCRVNLATETRGKECGHP